MNDILDTIAPLARDRDIDPARLAAVVEIESGGRVFAKEVGPTAPVILTEPHVFHRSLVRRYGRDSVELRRAVTENLAAPRWGQISYPRGQRARYAWLERASEICRESAHDACSWGVGQVLGENATSLGYDSAVAMRLEMERDGLTGQVKAMLRFIDLNGLTDALRAGDWITFASGYNGPLHAKHDYAGRMERAYRKFSGGRASPVVLREGSTGPSVRELQTLIGEKPDGSFGQRTAAAVRAFQSSHGLVADGVVGPRTWNALRAVGVRPHVQAPATPAADIAAKAGGVVVAAGSVSQIADVAGVAKIVRESIEEITGAGVSLGIPSSIIAAAISIGMIAIFGRYMWRRWKIRRALS